MADNKENMGTVTQQLSAVDDDIRKGGDVQEKTVASVALGMFYSWIGLHLILTLPKLLLSKPQSLTCGQRICFNCTLSWASATLSRP